MTLKKRIQQSFSNAAETYDVYGSVQKKIHQDFLEFSAPYLKGCMLDVGCGRSPIEGAMGLDLSFDMICQNSKRPVVVGDFDKLPFKSNSFDCIFSVMALQWSPDLFLTLKALRSLLKDRGKIIFAFPIEGTLEEIPASHRNSFLPLENLFQRSEGFKVLHLHEKIYKESFHSTKDALLSLKKTGSHLCFSKEKPKFFSFSTLTYRIAYGVFEKSPFYYGN